MNATNSPALLPRLATAATAGLKLLAVGIAALGLALVATVTTVVGVVTKVLAEVLAQLAGLIREALPFLLSIVPVLARSGLVLAVMSAVVWSWPVLYLAYAADLPLVLAGVMATMIVAAPIAYASVYKEWSMLLAATPIIFICAWILAHAGPGVRVAVVILPLGIMTASNIFKKEKRNEHRQERGDQPAGGGDARWSGSSDRLSNMEFSANDDGGTSPTGGHPGNHSI